MTAKLPSSISGTKLIVIIIISFLGLAVLCVCSVSALIMIRNSDSTGSGGVGEEYYEEFDGDKELIGAIPVSELWDMEYEMGQELKVYGVVSSLFEGIPYFYLMDGSTSAIVYYQMMMIGDEQLDDVDVSGIKDGDTILVNGKFDTSTSSIYTLSITVVTPEDAQAYTRARLPKLQIEILEHPETVTHACRYFEIPLRLTNIGPTTITHEQVYDSDSGSNFFYYIDGVPQRSYWENDDGTVGLMGLKDFEPLEPGESIDVIFGGGGMVTETVDPSIPDPDGTPHTIGIAGEYNILSSGFNGVDSTATTYSKELKFVWGTFNYEDFDYLSPEIMYETEVLNITLQNDDCEIDDIQRTVDVSFWDKN